MESYKGYLLQCQRLESTTKSLSVLVRTRNLEKKRTTEKFVLIIPGVEHVDSEYYTVSFLRTHHQDECRARSADENPRFATKAPRHEENI